MGGVRGLLTAPYLWLGKWLHTLFPDTGENVPFEIENYLYVDPDGHVRMTFNRTFTFPRGQRRFVATMRFDEESQTLLDSLGSGGHLQVELFPSLEGGAITIRSGRQWVQPFGLPLRIPIPRGLAGEAVVKEWQENSNRLGIRVTITSPWLGDFFGYEGSFERVEDSRAPAGPDLLPETHNLSFGQRLILALVAVAGTIVYALSFNAIQQGELISYARKIGIAAGVSWLGLGAALVASATRVGVARWFDLCLKTMSIGMAVLSFGVLTNLVIWPMMVSGGVGVLTDVQLGLLGLSDILMGTYFVKSAGLLGLPRVKGLLLWVIVLNGGFAVLVCWP